MLKLLNGIIDFREQKREEYLDKYSSLAYNQSPDTLMIACSDSRVAPNVFASTNPGDLFVVRNVGNIIPPAYADGMSVADESEAAAIEFAVLQLNVAHIIVCGHSNCGAMHAFCNGREKLTQPNLKEWLRHAEALSTIDVPEIKKQCHEKADHISQINVLRQLEHLKTYPFIKKRIEEKNLILHGWWFDLKNADLYFYEQASRSFKLFSKKEVDQYIERMKVK